MSGAQRVRVTKTRQQSSQQKTTKPGKPYNGPNLVAQREASSKKSGRKAAAGRRKTA